MRASASREACVHFFCRDAKGEMASVGTPSLETGLQKLEEQSVIVFS